MEVDVCPKIIVIHIKNSYDNQITWKSLTLIII